MPLDVQPLSLPRRIARILVMLMLLGGSLLLAQCLVMKRSARQGGSAKARIEFLPPPGLAKMPVNASGDPIESMLVYAVVHPPQGERALFAFDYLNNESFAPRSYVVPFLFNILPGPDDPQGRDLTFRKATLGGVAAVQAERYVPEESAFAIIRIARVSGHLIAFCMSGEGSMTDADREYFEAYCSQKIKLH